MLSLVPFQTPSDIDLRISAQLQLGERSLILFYLLEGQWDSLSFPQTAKTPGFQDELWKTTCFEIFLQRAGELDYQEWNFSPSGNYAHYHFLKYRERTVDVPPQKLQSPIIIDKQDQIWKLKVEIPWETVGSSRLTEKWNYSLAAVTHDKIKNERHYWALTHAGPKPDFHDARSFTGSLEIRSS